MQLEIKETDRHYYEARLKDFLPERIIDIHTHIWLEKSNRPPAASAQRTAGWAGKIARQNTVEDLLRTYKAMFPGKAVTPLVFANPLDCDDLEQANMYVKTASNAHHLPALMLSHPGYSADQLQDKLATGNFIGIKPYLSFAPEHIAADDIEIFDFLPHHQLDVLNQHGLAVILHIPRPGRLKDPVNILQIRQIEKQYPNIRLIIAHVGRAYCLTDIGDAFDKLRQTDHVMFDISANTNADVFEQLIQAVGPERILFGSDLPIVKMRMRRICENGIYINIVPKGHYGDVSNDKHMREVTGPDAEALTFFLYEQIDAFRQASEAAGLCEGDIRDIFFDNAANVIESCQKKNNESG